jgi:hypothetical protein
MYKRPGVCGSLADEEKVNKGGAPREQREKRAANINLLRQFLQKDPEATSETLVQRFKKAEIEVTAGTVRRYRSEIHREQPLRIAKSE